MGRLDPAVAEVRRAVREGLFDLVAGARVVVACSGGADSLALAAAAVFEGRKAGWVVSGATVDHRLQAGSADVAERVVGQLLALGCESTVVLPVAVAVDESGPEAAARSARYSALQGHALPLEATVLLGHTLDDQAETVLLGLARGSGLRSLAGMAGNRSCFRRPLLSVRRASTRRMCEVLALDAWDDPHNADRRYARARVRHDVLPVLERELGPGVAEALARTATLARHDSDALNALGRELYDQAHTLRPDSADPGQLLDVDSLSRALPALRWRALRFAAMAAGAPGNDLSAAHIQAIDRLITSWRGQAAIDLPGHVVATRRGRVLSFEVGAP
ncbi:MAG: tRNA lysidine(34) synthetase TilS [Nocardioidaceae bacterium]|nr:tRNA lysidine(34) synthetase TilS [Nocardioidaceae bacterium]